MSARPFSLYFSFVLFIMSSKVEPLKPLEFQVEFMRCFEKQDGVAFILISYTHRNEYYYLTFKKLTEFWDRAAEGGRKSFRYEELEPAFFLPEVPGILVPYLNALQLDLNCRA